MRPQFRVEVEAKVVKYVYAMGPADAVREAFAHHICYSWEVLEGSQDRKTAQVQEVEK